MRRTPAVYSYFNPPPAVHAEIGTGPGADQSFKDECDINRIVAKYDQTGFLIDPLLMPKRMPLENGVDATLAPDDFLGALQTVQAARDAFGRLNSKVRDRFRNDVGALLAFLADPSNKAEAIELGLIDAPPASPPPPVTSA